MMKRLRLFAILLLSLCNFCLIQQAQAAVELKADAPTRYTVQEGDTLWGIAQKYLKKPWQWQQLLRANPQIKNPDRLYAGSILYLHRSKHGPYLSVRGRRTVKLSPNVRVSHNDDAIPTIPLSLIKPFLEDSRIFVYDRLSHAPYIVDYANEHLIGSPGMKLYANQLIGEANQKFGVFRPKGALIDPDTKEVLGFDGMRLGDAELITPGEPATLVLTSVKRPIQPGDRLFPDIDNQFDPYFELTVPGHPVEGKIIAIYGGMTQVGANQVVVLNLGEMDDIQPGDVLAVSTSPRFVLDPVSRDELVTLPRKHVGEVMVFRSFDRVSFALVMAATSPVHELDSVTNP